MSTPINVENQPLTMCKNFTYLGSTVLESASLHQEITLRMGKASAAYGKLQKRLWRNRHVTIRAECKLYRAVMLSTLLCNAETWTIYQSQPPPQALRFSQCRGKRLVMNRKRPWEGYRLQEKRRLARCLLPAFLCAHIFVERETCGYEAVPVTSEEATGLHDAPSQRGNQHILERQNHKQSKSREGWPTAYGWYFNSDEPEKALPCGEDGLCQGFRAAVVFLASEQVL